MTAQDKRIEAAKHALQVLEYDFERNGMDTFSGRRLAATASIKAADAADAEAGIVRVDQERLREWLEDIYSKLPSKERLTSLEIDEVITAMSP